MVAQHSLRYTYTHKEGTNLSSLSRVAPLHLLVGLLVRHISAASAGDASGKPAGQSDLAPSARHVPCGSLYTQLVRARLHSSRPNPRLDLPSFRIVSPDIDWNFLDDLDGHLLENFDNAFHDLHNGHLARDDAVDVADGWHLLEHLRHNRIFNFGIFGDE